MVLRYSTPTPSEAEQQGLDVPNVRLICNDGRSLPVHGSLLERYSTYFRRCFEYPHDGPFRVRTNFGYGSIKCLIEFLYTGDFQLPKGDPAEPCPENHPGCLLYDQEQSEEHAFDVVTLLVELHNLALCYHIEPLQEAAHTRITPFLADCTGKQYLLRAASYTLEHGMDETIKTEAASHVLNTLRIYSLDRTFSRFMWSRQWCTALRKMSQETAQHYFNSLAAYNRLHATDQAQYVMDSLPVHYQWVMSYRSHRHG